MWLIPEESERFCVGTPKKPDETIKVNISEDLKAKYKDPSDYIKGWKTPVEITFQRISRDIQEKEDAYIIEEIRNIGVNVNKEELIKALNYDRQQYSQGYKNGYKDGYAKGIDDCLARLKELISEVCDVRSES